MRFSIIIPAHNEEMDIAATLEALLALDYPDREILVVDDSSDRTPETVGGYARQGVRLIHPGAAAVARPEIWGSGRPAARWSSSLTQMCSCPPISCGG